MRVMFLKIYSSNPSYSFPYQRMEMYYLIGYTLFVTLAHIHYGVMIVIQMSDHFNIHTFSLAKKEKLSEGEKPKVEGEKPKVE